MHVFAEDLTNQTSDKPQTLSNLDQRLENQITLIMALKDSPNSAQHQDVAQATVSSANHTKNHYPHTTRPVPENKFTLLLFPISIFSACVALFVLSVTAITESRMPLDEDEYRMIVVRSYPEKANYSVIAMVCVP